eukprot:CAMPEP_0175936352 /NCGR_PEP_ID=MMETSP0108-20121206/21562_1 /TAXON_ID=195067 ORGANISM="Goniomonas pacifica, Strain CCMP1869" /NCGR_SAMPLE_ID=MMETSP0108 /ASSEMBLY_ACC=CAM_ASM_000204 /LENGTH=290 /DNA_ID=CAMNT_0017260421 /DNA_START=10 /DNA_END=882 /DNA_ORIENTATION=-
MDAQGDVGPLDLSAGDDSREVFNIPDAEPGSLYPPSLLDGENASLLHHAVYNTDLTGGGGTMEHLPPYPWGSTSAFLPSFAANVPADLPTLSLGGENDRERQMALASTSTAGGLGLSLGNSAPKRKKESKSRVYASDGSAQKRKKPPTPWTEEEHRIFLSGLKKYGRGNWRLLSTELLPSRTPSQIASHAQKYFLHLSAKTNKRPRKSLFEWVLDPEEEARAYLGQEAQGGSVSPGNTTIPLGDFSARGDVDSGSESVTDLLNNKSDDVLAVSAAHEPELAPDAPSAGSH